MRVGFRAEADAVRQQLLTRFPDSPEARNLGDGKADAAGE